MSSKVKFFLLAGILVLLTGCETLSRSKSYYLENASVEFTLPKVWEENNSTEHALSLSNFEANLEVTSYRKSETKALSASWVMDEQIREFLGTMDTYSLVKEYPVERTADRVIYQRVYTANKDLKEKQYYFGIVDFLGTDHYVFVVYEARELVMKYNVDDVQRILLRMKCKEAEEDLVLY